MFTRLLVAGAAAVVIAAGTAQVAFAGEMFDGKVVAAQEKHVTVSDDNDQRTFIIDADTKIKLDGVAATWADLKPGYDIAVTVEKQGDQFLAKEIDAYVDD